MPGTWRSIVLLSLSVPLVACPGPTGGGSFHASWAGLDTGRVTGKPHATWCPGARRLEISAVQGDQGVGLALYPDSSPEAGAYPAFDPGADTVRRPGVAAGLRWFSESAVRGYQGDSGSLTLTREGERLSGRFGFRLRSLEGADTVRMSGEFSGAAPGNCPADSTAVSDSTR